ncbi:MAG: hypothetical protein ACLPWS_13040 [Rhodomicrobium sp.]
MLQTGQSQRRLPAPNYHFVQNYVRDNPYLALDYFSALVRYFPQPSSLKHGNSLIDVIEVLSEEALSSRLRTFVRGYFAPPPGKNFIKPRRLLHYSTSRDIHPVSQTTLFPKNYSFPAG